MARSYPIKDVKLLFGLSASLCAFPGCRIKCIEDATSSDPHAIIGKIAHIEAHSDKGPRANPTLTASQRDCYDNWILLCPTHHDLVDLQPNTYTVSDLRKWKQDLEHWVKEMYLATLPRITFKELSMITGFIIEAAISDDDDNRLTPPKAKLIKNGLSAKVDRYLKMGLVQRPLVEKYITHMEVLEANFSKSLINGFQNEYNRLRDDKGLNGDSLFFELLNFASHGQNDFEMKSAGLAVLSHLFILCEVFEK